MVTVCGHKTAIVGPQARLERLLFLSVCSGLKMQKKKGRSGWEKEEKLEDRPKSKNK